MKKTIIICLILCICSFVNAQKQSKIPAHLLGKTEKMIKTLRGDEMPVIINESNPLVSSKNAKDLGTEIGITFYDLQSNANNGNRMMVYPDGSISAVWTMAPTSSFANRGSGYNHSTNDGTNWLASPTTLIEGSVRTGWPNVGKLTNGWEVVVSHNNTTGNICRSSDGGANWENIPIGTSALELSWPRMYVNGNTIHVIANSNTETPFQGFENGALLYLKSTDNGTTWTTPIIPTGLDTSNYSKTIGFTDGYAIAGKGDTIAIVYGDGFRTTCLVKSTDNGDTWTYQEILHLPIKKFDTEGSVIFDINGDSQQDNLWGNDGVNFVTLDANGKAHVFFGRMNYTDDGSGAGYNYFPYTDGLYYWNEDMGPINFQFRWADYNGVNTYEGVPDTVNFPIITEVVDINNNGTLDLPDNGSEVPFGPYYCSISSFPVAVIVPDGTITLFYSSLVEGTDGTVGSEHRAFRNIWEVHKLGGATNNFEWSTPVRIASDDFTEEVWPCVSPVTTASSGIKYAHLWYMGDGYPGNSLQPSSGNVHPITENTIYYLKTQAYIDGINEINVVKSAPVVYPNPASKNVTVSYNLTDAANVTLSIYNMIGQQIMTTNQKNAAGDVKVTLNIESLTQGVYFIKSEIGNKTYTNKLIVK